MRRQLVSGLVVRLTVIKAKTRPGIEARLHMDEERRKVSGLCVLVHTIWRKINNPFVLQSSYFWICSIFTGQCIVLWTVAVCMDIENGFL